MILTGLSEQQLTAITTTGNILLTACPGSGKTRVLTRKIAHELEKIKETKKVIIAITFTNRASDEIKTRLVKLDIDTDQLFSNTIHSFCLEWILKPYASYLEETKNGFVVADEFTSADIIGTLKEDNDLSWWTPINLRIKLDGSFYEQTNSGIVLAYHEILKSAKLIDFEQILYYSYKLLISFPGIAKTLSKIFHLICVDEYQDTQELQYAILGEILKAEDSKTGIFLVGDRDQAIFGTLGGIAKNLEEIKQVFGNIEIVELELSGNYRTIQRIIDYYKNFQTTPIDIRSMAKNATAQGFIAYDYTVDYEVLSEHVASIIEKHLNDGVPESEICVLAPQWYIVIPMGRKLKRLLPKVNFDAYGLSPLSGNKENVWYRISRLFLSTPSPNMYLTRVRWSKELIQELDTTGHNLLSQEDFRHKKLLSIINSIKSDKDEGLDYLEDVFIQLMRILQINLDGSIYLKQHWDSFFTGVRRKLEHVDSDYAKDISSFKRLFNQKNGVVVNTCHGIKGEEFEVVISFGLLQGFVPHNFDPNPEDAARKLLYVICSRAKSHLYLISESGRTRTYRKIPYIPTTVLRGVDYIYDDIDKSAALL